MTERTVSVRLTLKNDGFIAGLKQAKRQTSDFTDGVSKSVKKNKGDLDTVARGFAGVGLAAGAGVAVATAKFADFDKAMSNVKAATHETAGNMAELRDAAIDAGAKTAFSATEAAGAIENLAKAGVSTSDILGGGLKGALDLAAAGELGVADAAEIAATAMTQFGLSGKDVPHIADLLAAGAGKAQGEVSDMAMALKQGGLVAAQMGLSIEETTGTLAAFASAGLIGSDAGTSFKTMLLQLANPSAKAASTMNELGIAAYDTKGNFVGIAPLAEQLKTKLQGLTPAQRDSALATIFGSDAIRAANVLYKDGAAGISDWTAKVNDQGFAAETAAIKTDNLKGDIERLGGALDTALIQAGAAGNDVLRSLVQNADDGVAAFSELPGWLQKSAFGLAGVAAFGGLGAAALVKGVEGATEFRGALQQLNAVSGKLKFGLGGVGLALTAAAVVFGAFANESAESREKVQAFADTLDKTTGAITGNTRAYVANELAQSGLAETAKGFGLSLSSVTDAALGNKDAMTQLVDQLNKVIDANIIAGSGAKTGVARLTEQGESAKKLRDEILGMNGSLTEAQKVQKLAAEGATEHKTSQQLQAEAVKKSNEKIQKQTTNLADLIEQMHAASGQSITLSESQIGYNEALSSATEAIKENGKEIDRKTGKIRLDTKEGRENQAALNDLASATNDQTDAMLRNGESNDKVRKTAEAARKKFVEVAIRMGLNKAEAEKLSQAYIDIPDKVDTKVTNNAAAKPTTDVLAYQGRLGHVPVEKNTNIKTSGIPKAWSDIQKFSQNVDTTLGGIADEAVKVSLSYVSSLRGGRLGQNPEGHATGGPVFGAGTETSDSIPALLSNNEHVWTAKEVQAAGGHGAVKKMRQSVLQGFANGGEVAVKMNAAVPSLRSINAANAAVIRAMGADIYEAREGPAAQWAQSQVGKPYIWGGVGPAGYDCSGFMSAITNVIMGRNPHSRLFATGSFPTGMFSRGMGRFAIGSVRGNPGHMAGTLGGMDVESRGGAGVVVGSRARGARDPLFGGNIYHLNGYAKGGAVAGRDGDPPFDLIDPRGKAFKVNGYRDGGVMMPGEFGYNETSEPEVVLNKPQLADLTPAIDYDLFAASVLKALDAAGVGSVYATIPIDLGHGMEKVVRSTVKAINREAAHTYGIGG